VTTRGLLNDTRKLHMQSSSTAEPRSQSPRTNVPFRKKKPRTNVPNEIRVIKQRRSCQILAKEKREVAGAFPIPVDPTSISEFPSGLMGTARPKLACRTVHKVFQHVNAVLAR
jgi:hypothetical protein